MTAADMAALDRIDENLTDAERVRLVDMRGGCSCHISPPCFRCTEPMTMAEAEDLGLWPEQAPEPDLMAITRAMCGRT